MPLLEVKRKLTSRSERVKCVDLHPREPWLLTALFNGTAHVWNYELGTLIKSFEVADGLPVRAAVFVDRKTWVITGSDDYLVKVFNYNTMNKVKTIEAHNDYIRSIAVHPTQPFILTSSDDMSIRLWDWDKNWTNTMLFDGHTHFVMKVVFNPKDPNMFASASLDRTVKVWGLNSPNAYFTLTGHDRGVNSVDYLSDGDKPYLVSGSDDKTAKIWDYQTKTCVATLSTHEHHVSAVAFHPELPYVITASEDGNVRVFNSSTFRIEKTLNYGLERPWTVRSVKGSNGVAIGFDQGAVFLKFGSDRPSASMDQSGKIIMAKHSEIKSANTKGVASANTQDGERLTVPIKDLGNSEVYPKYLQHSPNGRFVALCGGDGEYVIYTALAWRNKAFGKGEQIVWGDGALAGTYAVRESSGKVNVFRDFKQTLTIKTNVNALNISGGTLLNIRHSEGFEMRSWDGRLVRQIDVSEPKKVYWSTVPGGSGSGGDMAILATASSFYVLKYDSNAFESAFAEGKVSEDGVEEAIEVLHEVHDKVRCGVWVGECFLYLSAGTNKLCYCVGGHSVTVAHLPRKMHLLGYIPKDNRVYLVDKDLSVVSYKVNMSVINYQIATERGNEELAQSLAENIPQEEREKVAIFLEGKGLFDKALEMSTDNEHRFELALRLKNLSMAHKLAVECSTVDSKLKWKQLGDLALQMGLYNLAKDCLVRAGDFSSLLVLYTSLGDDKGLSELQTQAEAENIHNIAFISSLALGNVEHCLDILTKTHRIAEAAIMARTYLPSKVSPLVTMWKESLKQTNKRAAEALADPDKYPNLFGSEEELKSISEIETYLEAKRKEFIPAEEYADFITKLKQENLAKEAHEFCLNAQTETKEPISPKSEQKLGSNSEKEEITSKDPPSKESEMDKKAESEDEKDEKDEKEESPFEND